MNEVAVETNGTQPDTPVEAPKVAKKTRVAPHGANVPSPKTKSAKKAKSAAKAAKSPKSGKSAPKKAASAEKDSMTAKVLGMLKRSGGATLKQLTTATGWQSHSVRGFLSGALGKKMGLKINSTKAEGAERRYSVKG